MRDELHSARLGAGMLLAGLLAGAAPVAAQDLYGHLEIQYQKSDIQALRYYGDGSATLLRRQREIWLQTYEANHQAYPRQSLLLQSQLRFNRQDDLSGLNRVTTPQGNVRLYHPWFNLYASYKPTKLRTEIRTPIGAGDSVLTSQLDTHFSEAQFTGHFARPRLPQFDVNWIRRLRSDSGSPLTTYGREQSARLSYQYDWFNVYAGVTQQRAENRGAVTVVPLDQRVLNAGGALTFAPRPTAAASLLYDVSDTRAGYSGQRPATTQTHSLTANADWRFRPRWSTGFNWNYHHAEIDQYVHTMQNDNEGALSLNWEPWRRGRVTGSAGVRTLHQFLQPDRYIKYITETVGSDGMMRPGWQVGGQISNSNNWDPERGNYAVQTFGFNSRMDARRRIRLDANWQLSTNSDTAAAGQNVSVNWGARLYATPLRNLTFDGGVRSSRFGSSLVSASAVSRTRTVGFTWRPMPAATLIGSYSSTGLMPNDSPRNVTRLLSGQYAPSERLQLTGIWSRSNQERANPLAGGLAGREVISGRLQSSLTRRLTVSFGMSVSDPGQPQVSKQYDAVMTWSFGR